MKLRHKKTGEIYELELYAKSEYLHPHKVETNEGRPITLSELSKEYEDYEEPKEVWYIDFEGVVRSASKEEYDWFKENEIGNYFETKEQAEKAVEKLKAWKRLEDKGFRFNAWYGGSKNIDFEITSLENETYIPRQICNDLDLLFGGKE